MGMVALTAKRRGTQGAVLDLGATLGDCPNSTADWDSLAALQTSSVLFLWGFCTTQQLWSALLGSPSP